MSMYDELDNDDSLPTMGDVDAIDGMAQFTEYKKIKVDSIIEDISDLSKKLIDSTCKFYLSNTEMFNDDDVEYINAIKGSERNNLQILLKQVKYVEHILDNLMRQLDNGGYMDNTIYTTIQEMQKSSMEITMQVSKYTRNLPDYFKFVKMDIEQSKEKQRLAIEEKEDIKSIASRSGNNTNSSGVKEIKSDDRFDRPYRGVRALLVDLEEEENTLDLAIEATKNKKPKPIRIDDDGEAIDPTVYDEDDIEDIDYEEEE